MAEQTCHNVAQFAFMCQFCDHQNVKWKCEDCGIFICNSCKEKVHPRLKSADKHILLSIKEIGKVNEPWYHGKMTRQEAVRILLKNKYMGNGAFLVRESANKIGMYSIDFLEDNQVRHLRIRTKEESGHLKYYSHQDHVYDRLKDILKDVKQQQERVTTSLGKQIILTEHVPKEPTCDK